ncbi:hypothetical protein HYC85_011661 [Camellia sinensis]|uniref:Uncharacterized protein n=1 Tax=Camellia sinensis TaxID=4442 RepID=A0A7J7HCT1_CAMSI|nr:hypothetical protein HYC85_011661 [Camellia sinensis]
MNSLHSLIKFIELSRMSNCLFKLGLKTLKSSNMWSKLGLDLPEILVEAERRRSSLDELLTIPEQDDWIYSDGKSTSCVVFILEMYKEAGLLDPIANSIQVT